MLRILPACFIFAVITPYSCSIKAQIYARDILTSRPLFIHEENTSFINVEALVLSSSARYTAEGTPNTKGPADYREMNIYFTLYLKNSKKYNLGFMCTAGIAAARDGGGRKNLGDPWLWLQYRLGRKLPIELRIALNFNRWGNDANLWPNDNKLDFGLAVQKKIDRYTLESLASYRIRGKLGETEHLNFGNYDEMGNEIHYRAALSFSVKRKVRLSAILTGYRGGNKFYQGKEIPDSHSLKNAIGTELLYMKESGAIRFYILFDLKTRYDRKGWMLGTSKSF